MNESCNMGDRSAAGVGKGDALDEAMHLSGRYEVECYDKHGNLKWRDTFDNLVTTVGKNNALDNHLSGSAYTAAWYMGLISATGYGAGTAAGDTMASHAGWTEDQQYDEASRPSAAFAAASGGSKPLSSPLSFSINASTTIKGAFIVSSNTKGGTAGVLYSAGLFSGGDKVVASGDTLNVSYTASA